MNHLLHSERPVLSSWIPAVWVLVGTQFLAVLYFALVVPPTVAVVGAGPSSSVVVLLELARVTAWANLVVVVGLWFWSRSLRSQEAGRWKHRLRYVMTALALLLPPLAFRIMAHRSPTAVWGIEQVWGGGQ